MQKGKKLLSALLALVMVLTAFPIMAFATDESGVRPADSKTDSQPFISGKPSQNYRIPGVVTLDDGTIVAVADARWNDTKDGGGNDVIVTRSTDGGSTWSYHMVNYFGDNGNSFNKSSTSFCDSSIATNGSKVYLLSTFFPAGYAINGSSANNRPVAESAFDNAGRLKLRLNSASTYDYYLDTNTKENGRYVIRRYSNNSVVDGTTVSEEFFIYNGNTKNGSIFYSDGSYQACKTTYLWFRSSDDGGVTWNAPRLLNLKSSSEQYFGVGPGHGIVTSSGDIVFTAYTWNYKSILGIESYDQEKNTQYTYLISSSDGGYTWKRSAENATSSQWWCSEATPVELPDGTIRCYLRNDSKKISEADAVRNADGTYSWTRWDRTKVNGTEIPAWTDCEVSALMYPYKINGKNAVLVACPTNTNSERKNGTIHVLLLDDNNNCTQRLTYAVTTENESYQYSSMDVLPNGNIAMLYESNDVIKYREIDIKDIAAGATVEIPTIKPITLEVGESYTFQTDTKDLTGYDSDVINLASKGIASAKCQLGTSSSYDGSTVPITQALYHFTASGSGYTAKSVYDTSTYVNTIANSSANYPQTGSASAITIEQGTGSDTSALYLKSAVASGGKYPYLMFFKGNSSKYYFDRWSGDLTDEENANLGCTVRTGAEMNLFRAVNAGEASSDEIPGFVKLSSAAEVAANTDYLIAYKANNGNYYVMYPSTSTSNPYSHVAKIVKDDSNITNYDVTVTGAKEGTTTIKVSDSLTYRVTVAKTVNVTGAVKYDPVIYTQGNDYTSFGTKIAEGNTSAEMKTAYQVAPDWTIDYIEVTEGVVASGTSVRAEDGKLKGTVQLTSGNSGTNIYERILVKTYLIGPDSKVYIQQDYLYVTTSPVPAHLVSQAQRYYQNAAGWKWVTMSLMGLVAKGSTSTYSTTGTSSNDQSTLANSIDLYGQDGMALTSFSYTDEAKTRTAVIKTGDKLGGFFSYVSTGGSVGTTYAETTGTTGHYYYDKSSSYNPGIKTSNGNTATIELVLNRPYISNTSDYLHDDNSNDPLDFNEISITVDGTKRLMAQKPDNSSLSIYSPSGVTPAFKTFTFAKGSANALQTFDVTINTSSKSDGETVTGNMFTYISHGRDSKNTYWAVNKSTLPFVVHVGDKSAVRTNYNNALTDNGSKTWDVLVSSDYTTSSWAKYQEEMLNATSYLNNYNYNQTTPSKDYGEDLKDAYTHLRRLADFSELDEQLRLKKNLYGAEFPFGSSGYSIYTSGSWDTFQQAYPYGDQLANINYGTPEKRLDAAGYDYGAHNDNKNDLQQSIDSYAEMIRVNPEYAADPSVFEAAKEIIETLDLDAYKVTEEIYGEVDSGNTDIYEEGQIARIVKIPASQQSVVDDHAATLLSTMNVATEGTLVTNNGAANHGRLCTVIIQVNGVEKLNYTYGYGTNLAFTVAPQFITVEQAKTATVVVTNDTGITNTIPLTSDNRVKFVAQGTTITVNIKTTNTPTVIVHDYFDTILYSGTATKDQITLDNDNATVNINGTIVNAKPSPAFTFDGWRIIEQNDGTIIVVQKGTRVGGTHTVRTDASLATVTPYGETTSQDTFKGYDKAYTVTALGENAPLAWKMTVTDADKTFTKTYLAGYEQSFTRFTSDYDVEYTPLFYLEQVEEFGAAYGKPVSYGDAYMSGDDGDKFTLSCFYSAAPDTTIAEAGILYSTDDSMTPDTMTKGADGVTTRIQTRVSEFGTYTMTKTKAIGTGTHLMRSYVSYTEMESGIEVIRVTYGPVYKCVDGQISIVE